MAPAHWVICKICGRKFDFEKEGGSYDGTRYICKPCVKNLEALEKAKKEAGWFKRNWKILFGVIFLIGGFGNIGENWEAALFGIIVGAGLTFWHIFPKAKAKKEAIEEREAIQKAQDEKITICPYCGGMTTGSKCEFCGMPLPDGEGMN